MKKILSILLSLALIFSAMSVLGGIGFTASAATTDNLLPNPNWDYTYDESTDTYSIENWLLPSKGDTTVYTDDDGSTVVNITTADNNSTVDFRSNKSMSLSRTSYYKFSIMYKLEDSPSGSYYTSGSGVWFAFRHNGQSANRKTLEKTSKWTEASFIIYGGNIQSSAWDLFFTIVADCTRCSLSLKNPSVTLYNPDDLDYKKDIVTENLLPETFDKFKYSKTASYYYNADTETVDLNGEEVTAFKLTRKNTNDNYAVYYALDNDDGGADYKLNLASKLDTSKKYLFSAWIKLDNADVYDETTGNWVAGDSYSCNKDAPGYGAAAYFMNASNTYYSERVTTFGEWIKVSYILDETSYSSWRCRVGINTYAIGCNLYVADVRLEEIVGNISVENAVNILENGDFSTYDAQTNEIKDLLIEGKTMPWYGGHTVETVNVNGATKNALKLTVNSESEQRRVRMNFNYKNMSADNRYKFSAWIKLENNSNTGVFTNDAEIGYIKACFHHGNDNNFGTTIYREKAGWQKIEFIIDSSVHGGSGWWQDSSSNNYFGVGINVYHMVCDIYLADLRLEELAGGDEERSGGFIQVNRNNAMGGDQVQVKVDVDEGFTLKRLYYTDGVDETIISENRATVSETPTHSGVTLDTTTYTSVASDKIYVFDMPSSKDITVMADYYYYLYGDINGDREFNAIDVVVLKKFVAGLGVEIEPKNLDTLEENINIYHVAALRNIFLGNEVASDVAVANVDSLTTLTPNFQ